MAFLRAHPRRYFAIAFAVTLGLLAGQATYGAEPDQFTEYLNHYDPEHLPNHHSPHDFDDCDHCGDHEDDEHSIKEKRPDEHAPAGLMGDHVHHQGEFMFEYKYMFMSMDGNRVGTNRVSDLAGLTASGVPFLVTPTDMVMNMHMIHMMYGLTDNITLYMMGIYTGLTMDHLRGPMTPPPVRLSTFTTHTVGWGDMTLGALWRIVDAEKSDLILNLGCVAPTGHINAKTTRAMPGMVTIVPYPMQVGGGTFRARPGITYKRYWENASMGTQLQTDLPIGRNYRNYTIGDMYRLNWWGAVRPTKRTSLSFRTEALWRTNYNGIGDPDLNRNPNLVSTARTDMRGGTWINLGFGGIYQTKGGARLNVEFVLPVYQDLEGVQLETDFGVFASFSKAF